MRPEPSGHWSGVRSRRAGLPIIIYMGMSRLPEIASALMTAGLSPETPVAVVCEATTPRQRILVTTLDSVARDVDAQGLGRAIDRRHRRDGQAAGSADPVRHHPRPMTGEMPPGLMIAAPRSGSGKTTLDLGAFARPTPRRRGGCQRQVRPRLYRSSISSRRERAPQRQSGLRGQCRPHFLECLAIQVGIDCELIICEALMGLFDGVPGPAGRTGSSADVAAALGWPVLLVLDASGQSQSAAAIVKGCATYDPRITIAGVVLNRIGSPRHARLATDAIEALGIPVVGSLPRSDTITLPERHLGLVQAGETDELDERLERIATFVAEHTRIDAIRALASPGRPTTRGIPPGAAVQPPGQPNRQSPVMRRSRSSIRTCCKDGAPPAPKFASSPRSPMRHRTTIATPAGCRAAIPNCTPADWPQSRRFMDGLRRFAETRPIHGECGGYMTLGTSLTGRRRHRP